MSECRAKRDTPVSERVPAEGELYRALTVFGESFELRYGYYDEIDRGRPPDIIYPDFIKEPRYTKQGFPFVTMMQDTCKRYRGKRRTEDTSCADCQHFIRGEEWFGLCGCPANMRKGEN